MKLAEGFSDLYDKVLKDDYTPMRKRLTEYLRGPKQYYQYMRLVMGTVLCAFICQVGCRRHRTSTGENM